MASHPITHPERNPANDELTAEQWLEEWKALAPRATKQLEEVGGVEAWHHYLRHGEEDESQT